MFSTVKINLPGGIVPAGELLLLLEAAERAEVEYVQFGHRQQLLFSVATGQRRGLLHALGKAGILAEVDADAHPNLVSSYVVEEVFHTSAWLREGVYRDLLDLFDYRPRLKINLIDRHQTFVPFFTGNLNFITSDIPNYWYLSVRWPQTNARYDWPTLVYSEDIPALSSAVERVILANKAPLTGQPAADGALLHSLASAGQRFVTQPVPTPLALPEFTLPYYEGFNRYGSKLWLGIYRRDEQFAVAFLKDICQVCLRTRVGQLCVTPWKSILIKGIELTDRPPWDAVLRRHRINVRHAANELNWQVEDRCAPGLALKHELVRHFNEEDIRTYQLCFVIKTKPQTGLFGSIVVRRHFDSLTQTGLHAEQYELLHTHDFNPNSKDFISFRKKVSRENLPWYLAQLCDQFYEQQALPPLAPPEPPPTPAAAPDQPPLHQCPRCFTVYDEADGDPAQGIAPGTPWGALAGYACPTCEAPKEEFAAVPTPNSQWLAAQPQP
ncbi:rubredoxin [Hymenobacter psoromatis]|uniref:rubredoxin n=1 Tax=Hymenobacter psoromatis TaxID=1484116 RepID=UPI0021D45313|nr:rubredoxin [Hymenobacter psoromatis]